MADRNGGRQAEVAAIYGEQGCVDGHIGRELRGAALAVLIAAAVPGMLMLAGSSSIAAELFADGGVLVQESRSVDVQLGKPSVVRALAAPTASLASIGSTTVTTRFTVDVDTSFSVVALFAGEEVATQIGSAVGGDTVTTTVSGLLPATDYSLVVILGEGPAASSDPIRFRTAR